MPLIPPLHRGQDGPARRQVAFGCAGRWAHASSRRGARHAPAWGAQQGREPWAKSREAQRLGMPVFPPSATNPTTRACAPGSGVAMADPDPAQVGLSPLRPLDRTSPGGSTAWSSSGASARRPGTSGSTRTPTTTSTAQKLVVQHPDRPPVGRPRMPAGTLMATDPGRDLEPRGMSPAQRGGSLGRQVVLQFRGGLMAEPIRTQRTTTESARRSPPLGRRSRSWIEVTGLPYFPSPSKGPSNRTRTRPPVEVFNLSRPPGPASSGRVSG